MRAEEGKVVKQAHIVVAIAFIPNPDKLPVVNHINGIRDDNRVVNLEWVSIRDNRNKRVFHQQGNFTRPVIQYTLAGTKLATWSSISEASTVTGVYRNGITRCCRGDLDHTNLYRWAYVESEVDPTEEWRKVEAKGRTLEVSSLGRFRTRGGGTTFGATVNGYRVASDALSIHRLVALAFCPKSEGKDVVNHKDGNRDNNRADNLEWVTQAENVQHAIDTGLRAFENAGGRPIRCLLDGIVLAEYPSIAAASRATNTPLPNIVEVCKGRGHTAGGFAWEYIEIEPSVSEPLFLCVLDTDPIWDEIATLAALAIKIPDDDPLWADLGL
jgi:hypothetical protein